MDDGRERTEKCDWIEVLDMFVVTVEQKESALELVQTCGIDKTGRTSHALCMAHGLHRNHLFLTTEILSLMRP